LGYFKAANYSEQPPRIVKLEETNMIAKVSGRDGFKTVLRTFIGRHPKRAAS
jgi:hypothetical protein